jgi:hypothetical protein
MCCNSLPLNREPSFDANAYLAERFKTDVCPDCGRAADGHTVTLDKYGDPRVRCDADDEDDPLVVRAANRRWMLGYLR